jgi:hypothetical protein
MKSVLRRLVELGRTAPPRPTTDIAALADAWPVHSLAGVPESFALVRILGNDLEPRHARGQARANLAFVLAHEPPLDACEKRWVVNRISDADEEAAILALLTEHGQGVFRIPFDRTEYARVGWDTGVLPDPALLIDPDRVPHDPAVRRRLTLALYRARNAYVMNNNGARNAAIGDGRDRAKWVLPWDGNCFVTAEAWAAIRAAVAAAPHLKYFTVPMARVPDNACLLDPGFVPNPVEEPQVILRRDADLRFDEGFVYGRRPKVEMLWRLGVPGPWDRWRDDPWDPPRNPPAPEAGQVGTAGWVARLASGREDLEREDKASFLDRGVARQTAIIATIDRIDADLAEPDPAGLTCYSSAALEALAARCAAGVAPLATALLAAAEEALGRGPFSVTQKTTLPPGGNRHDYWHPAPYWWPRRFLPGLLPYVQRDGERVPGTRLYEPESERYDRTRLQRLFDDTTALALAFALTGREDFAAHAARNVETWFVDPATAMTPHLRYAQVRRGRNSDEGTGTGIIEFKDLYYFLDAVRLLERGDALAPATAAGLDAWLKAYLGWLETSRPAAREQASGNNHGTYFDLQAAAIAARLDDRERLRDTLIRAEARLAGQITADGLQPHEMRRTTTAHYCLFNLQGWLNLLRLGKRCGLLRPDPGAEPWVRVVQALDWTLGHDLARWPHAQIGPFDPERGLPLAAHAGALGLRPATDPATLAAAKPVFDPHDGIPPFWALTDPSLADTDASAS